MWFRLKDFFSVQKETPISRLKGVDEGLSSLYLQCLGIEIMSYIISRVLFKSILVSDIGYFVFVILPQIFAKTHSLIKKSE